MKLSFLLLFLVSACQVSENPENTSTISLETTSEIANSIPTSSVEIEEKPESIVQTEATEPNTSSNTYSWLETYDASDAIANRIAPPTAFRRKPLEPGSIAEWLRYLPLKAAGSAVHLYNGDLKYNQHAHFAVVNIDVGTRDLQQCADAIMRLKAEYHYAQQDWAAIHFNFSDGTEINFSDWSRGNRPILNGNRWKIGNGNGAVSTSYSNFRKYLNLVYGYAGTATLAKELRSIEALEIQAGDVFIQGGHPGHAILVIDIVENETGQKRFLLAQSYMPAQEIHILKAPGNPVRNPWYEINPEQDLVTPEWTFQWSDLKRFP